MPYKDPVKQREACRISNKKMRLKAIQNGNILYGLPKLAKNRLRYLELEVVRLQKCLDEATKSA
jgi:hypothetical protein